MFSSVVKSIAAAGVVLVGLSFAGTIPAEARTLAGTWNGGGTAITSSGKRERVRCRVSYTRAGNGSFRLNGRCASTSGSSTFSGSVSSRGGNSYSGSAFSQKYGASASVFVRQSGRSQTVTVRSSKGSARVTLRK